MNEKNKNDMKREMPHSHLLHALLPVCFVIIWILDTQIFLISTWLNDFIPFLIRMILFVITLSFAFILIFLSHKAIFHGNGPSDTLITRGILTHVRNPMYLGVLLIYIAFIFLSISIICIVFFIIIFLIYNKMVNYEENVLYQTFGDKYLKYKEKVPKWIPRLSKQT